ncbi:hypothetical protein NPS70_24815 [Streptomyces sp. C10-9-1]|uniref:hypothetical protein n=1 Tax=Streptomyces sp. C10-9-1 TaxID=1859285 RepID=UPI002112CB70|nr:hypothetical protein [Streptomyces sp. C10-9-1]MCQ6556379.1 hypothetical protein [Streptomyces sp. C10-9-1]
MTSSRLEPPSRTTGAHRARRRPVRTTSARSAARHEPYLDGLFTYCLSVLCDRGAATAALGEVLAAADRHRGRCPSGEERRRAWLYALARWACLRRMAEDRRRRPGAHSGRVRSVPDPAQDEELRAELARLAWPEAAGTTPEQREALELSVRHGLGPAEVAAVLGLGTTAARELLASAACELERTRAALAVVEKGTCPAVARLAGDSRVLVSAALRRELVRHVDDCPRCRRAAEREGAGGPWPGSCRTPAALPLVQAPRSAAYLAALPASRARSSGPRLGPDGFPLDARDQAARRDRLRARAVTTTVVATVVAAPVLALWAAYRSEPPAEEGERATAVSAEEAEGGEDGGYGRYENAGSANAGSGPRLSPGRDRPAVSVEVVGTGTPSPPSAHDRGPGRLTVRARSAGGATLVTLSASGASPVAWRWRTDAFWLVADRSSGVLEPGETITLRITVDASRQPSGPWRARMGVDPSGFVVVLRGSGPQPGTPPPPAPGPDPVPEPSDPPPSPDPSGPGPDPSPEPSDPPPSPEPSEPVPSPDPSGGGQSPSPRPSAEDPSPDPAG